MDPIVTGMALIAVGVLTMFGAALNWGIVSRPGKLLNRIFGDMVARIIYFVGGGVVFFAGIARLVGIGWF